MNRKRQQNNYLDDDNTGIKHDVMTHNKKKQDGCL